MLRTVRHEGRSWVENLPSTGRRALDLRELWAYRELVWYLAARDVRVRYKQAFFGAAWAVVQPLAGALVFTFVFRRLAGVRTTGVPYILFVFVGFLAWTYVSSTISTATDSLVSNISLVTKVYFPRIVAPLAAALPGLVDLGAGFVALAALMVITGYAPPAALVTAPVWLFAMVVLAVGVGFFLSTLQVKYRDTRPAAALFLQLWLFLSPVAYPASLVPDRWQDLYAVNPMVGLLGALRWSLLDTPWPGRDLLVALVVTLVIVVLGLRFFLGSEHKLADVI